jgi:excisionase family DNA binding protein
MSKEKSIQKDRDYMNIDELSEMLKISISHIYKLTSKRKIPHIKLLGKKLLFDKDAIKNWIKDKSVEAK